MWFKDFFKKRKKEEFTVDELEMIEFMKKFAEGQITVYEFWEEYNKNKILYDIINNDDKLPEKNKPFLYDNLNLNKLYHRCEIFRVVECFFLRRNMNLSFYNEDSKIYSEMLSIVPRYIETNQWFIDNVWNCLPVDVSNNKKKKELKIIIAEKYKYINYPPKWLQGAEWPIINNVPAIFIKQNVFPNNMTWDIDEIEYYFRDIEGNDIVVKQST